MYMFVSSLVFLLDSHIAQFEEPNSAAWLLQTETVTNLYRSQVHRRDKKKNRDAFAFIGPQ